MDHFKDFALFNPKVVTVLEACVEVFDKPKHDEGLVEQHEKVRCSIVQPITSFLLGLAEHTPETKEEDDYGEDQFGNQTGVVLDFGHAFDLTCAAANRERAHEKAKEQEQTLANYHPSDGF